MGTLNNKRHGYSGSPTYITWKNIKNRCNPDNVSHKTHPCYHGVSICDAWLSPNGFDNFLKDMGEKPTGMTIDRIDGSRGYSPENCRWASSEQQSNNRPNYNRKILIDGKISSVSDLSRMADVTYMQAYHFIERFYHPTRSKRKFEKFCSEHSVSLPT